MRRRYPLIIALVAAVLTAGRVLAEDGPAAPAGKSYRGSVERVVDGDTVVVRRNGRTERIRLVQIDAPESSATRYGQADACGAAATRFARRLVRPGATVTVEPAGSDPADRYGRVLAYVRLGGGDAETWQEAIVRAGWARPLVVGGNKTPLLGRLRGLAAAARRANRGAWGACAGAFRTAR